MSKRQRLTSVGANLAVAACALVNTGCQITSPNADTLIAGQIVCYGINRCRSQGTCATAGNSCRGQNTCAQEGLTVVESKAACKEKGGTPSAI